MNLNLNSDIIQVPEMHYVFIEKKGPFMETAPAAWQELHKHLENFKKNNKVKTALSLYKIQPEMIYRAGVAFESKPTDLPAGFQYVHFKGGKYSRFVLKGSYAQLPEACGKVFETVAKTALPVRDDFFIENYVNDPTTTAEQDLITEIMIPTK